MRTPPRPTLLALCLSSLFAATPGWAQQAADTQAQPRPDARPDTRPDTRPEAAEALASRLREHGPQLDVTTGRNDPRGFDLVVNATPIGMSEGDPLPFDVERLAPETFVGEVVMTAEYTPLLEAARARGCRVQIGTDMLFEMIPAYLQFFSFGSATADELRSVAQIRY